MKELVLVQTGEANGIPYYQPLDAEDAKTCAGHDTIVAVIKSDKAVRSILQNSSIYLYFTLLCVALNDAGLDMIVVLKALSKNAEIPWSPTAIKERLWRPVQKHTYDTDSTTQLETDQVSIVYEALNLTTSSKFGISIPFPDRFALMNEQLGRK